MNPFHPQGPSGPPRLVFADFELRLDSGELLRAGSPVKLQPQPAKILEILASRSGEVVSREEIRQLVWGDAFVDFDASLNFSIKEIRRALGDSATAPRYVETIPKRGYRFLEPVQILEPIHPAAAVPVVRPKRTLLAGLAAAALLAILLVFLVGSRWFQPHSEPPRLAVLPLKCQSRDPADRQICIGITDALTAELIRQFPRDLEVVAPVSSLTYGESGKSPGEIGRRLKATYLLSGTASLSSQVLQVKVRLVRANRVEPLWEESFETDLGDAPLLYERLTRQLARSLRLPPPPSKAEASAAKPAAEGYESYLRGIYLLRQQRYPEAEKNLQDAVLQAPRFAPAYAALALSRLSYPLSPGQSLAATEASARTALQLDPDLAEAYLAMGHLSFYYRKDWERAGREYLRALALSPADAEVRHAYAFFLSGLGRHDDAIAAIDRARELDPASMMVDSDYAYLFYLARRYDEAIRQARSALELFPLTHDSLPVLAWSSQIWSHQLILFSALQKGDRQTALATAKTIMTLMGKSREASQLQDLDAFWRWWGERLSETAKTQPIAPYFLAMAAQTAGANDRALELLERYCREPQKMMGAYVAVEPAFDPLHSDPRFLRVVNCTGLPADAPARRALAQR